MHIERLDHLVLTIADMTRTLAFYTNVLKMEEVTFGEGRKALRFGNQKINLHPMPIPPDQTLVAHKPGPGTADLCFVTRQPLEDWLKVLRANGVELECGPVMRTGARAPLRSIYFRDPDENLVELSNEMDAPS
ncbi:VOC family protein [Sulfidibacter corallicola]|uniref:VOC family protein n=1 Tax=Sulfidibacter corallicola TaxID=2818388 RepID=A0A8A4TVJ1_SULCO|nr:VOC family protein [Sulfidibacter corallicola]QTD53188.1 VOC family protein [Sulfidibacter corallicola]